MPIPPIITIDKIKIDNSIEEKVFEDVKANFSGKTQMNEEDNTATYIFDFNEVKSSNNEQYPSLDDFNVQFRIQLRKYLTEYKRWSLSQAAKKLDCSIHTLKNYKEKKIVVEVKAPSKKKNNK